MVTIRKGRNPMRTATRSGLAVVAAALIVRAVGPSRAADQAAGYRPSRG